MAKLFSVISPPVSAAINEKSRKPESYPCTSGLSQNHSDNNSCMNRSLRSEFSCTNVKKNSSTPQANSDESSSCSLKEHDYIGLAEIASSCESSDKWGESSGNGDLKLGLDLSLWVNDAEDKHNVGQSNPPDSMGTIQNARTLGTREFHSTEIARTKVNTVIGVKRSYSEALGGNGPQGGKDCVASSGIIPNVGQQRPVQSSDPAFLKKNRQGNPVNDLRKGNCLPFYWNSCGQSQVQPFIMAHSRMASVNGLCNLSNDRTDNQRSSFESSHDLKENCFPVAGEHSSARNPAVGWPPIRAYRKNSLSFHSKPSGDNKGSSFYVKVNMDGVPIGRKVDLNAHESYESLVQDLENMFQKNTEYHLCSWTPTGIQPVVSNVSKPLRLLDPTADVVLTYEDKDGDCMLVGDIPWKMFVNTVKRLRIMKTSDKNAFAERYRKKPNTT